MTQEARVWRSWQVYWQNDAKLGTAIRLAAIALLHERRLLAERWNTRKVYQ